MKSLAFAAAFCLLAASSRADSLGDSLTYCNGFDGSLEPSSAAGAKEASGGDGFVEGVSGQAVSVAGNPFKAYSAMNLNYASGTASFWFKPSFLAQAKDKQGGSNAFCPFKATNFQLCYQASKHVCFFMTGKAKAPEGFVWDYSVASREISSWKNGEWHHIAFTWDAASGVKRLLFDGIQAAAGSTKWMRDDAGSKVDSFLLEAPGSYDELYLWSRPLTNDELWLLASNPAKAAVELKKLPQAQIAASPAQHKSLSFSVPRIDPAVKSVLEPGETFSVKIPVENASAKAFAGSLKLELIDFWGKPSGAKEASVSIAPNGKSSFEASFEAPAQKGIYKISCQIPGEAAKDLSSFAVWPKPQGKPDPESFFGNHVNSWGGGKYLDQAERLGQGWMRNHNMLQATWWIKVQPEPGAFVWKDSDALVDQHLAKGMSILGQLFGMPYWVAQSGPAEKKGGYPQALLPKWDLWENYVFETVSHFKGRIDNWEILNEPEVGIFWGGSAEDFAKACQIACQAAKRANPNCFIMAGGLTYPAWKWHEAAAKAGAFKYADAISLHYGCPGKAPEETYAELKSVVDHFNSLSETYEPKRRLPLWNTEGGGAGGSWLNGMEIKGTPKEKLLEPEDWIKSSARVVQGEAFIMSMGIPRHFIYYQNNGSPNSLAEGNMLDYNDAPTPKLIARVAMASLVDGSKFAGELRRPEGRFWAMLFERKDGKGSLALCWAGEAGELKLDASLLKGAKLLDLMANEIALERQIAIDGTPIYIKSPGSAKELLAALEKAKIEVVKQPEPLKELSADGLKPEIPALPDFVAPQERPSDLFTVDLRPHCTLGFADEKAGDGKGGWSDEGSFNDMREMPLGKLKFYGVPFDIVDPASNSGKSVVSLKGTTTSTMPLRVEIKVPNRKCRALYFLQSAAWGSPGEIGKYVIHYADGSSQTVGIKIPENNNNWWYGYNKEEVSSPVAVKVTNTASGKPAFRYLRVFEVQTKAWDSVITSIEFISNGGPQTPILLAISGV